MAWELIETETDFQRAEVIPVTAQGVLVLARDPVQPWEGREILLVDEPVRFMDLMAARGLTPEVEPTVLMVNGLFYSRAEWPDLMIRPGDRGALMWLPANGGKTSRVILGVVMIIVGAILSIYGYGIGTPLIYGGIAMLAGALLTPKVNMPTTDAANALAAPSPTYNLQAQGNYARLNQPIPVIYGRVRTFPDFAAQPWAEYVGNEQYLYELFVIGQGEYQIEAVRIEDQTLEAYLGADGYWHSESPFDDISWEIVQPGAAVTHFPVRVLISEAVAQQDLFTNQSIGPFQITDAEINEVGIDLVAPKGLYFANDEGGLDARGFSVSVYAQKLQQNGAAWIADGAEFLLGVISHTAATSTPQRLSARYKLADQGRYQFRSVRTDGRDDSARAGHDVNWVGLRGYVPGVQQYGNVTCLAFRAKATNQLSSASSRKINVIATRKLPTWHPDTGWGLPVATRSIGWAIADALRNDQYGGGARDDSLPLQELYRLERDVWRSHLPEGESFDYVFDRAMATWEAVAHMSRAGRCLTYQRGPDFIVVRDQYRAVPVALFNMRNIERGSFRMTFALNDEDSTDSTRVTYWDEQTWAPSTFDCVPPGQTNVRPTEEQLVGVQRRHQAAGIGHFIARCGKHRRVFGSFRTELEGRLVKPGDVVALSHDVPDWGLSAELVGYSGTGKTSGDVLTLSEPVVWMAGVDHYVGLATRRGGFSGPWRVTPGADDFKVVLAEPITDAAYSPYVGGAAERTRVSFGTATTYAARALILPPLKMKGNKVEISWVEDSLEAYDETGAVAPEVDQPFDLPLTARPVVRALAVSMSGNTSNPTLDLSWESSGDPSYYLVELSDDGNVYSRAVEPTSTSCRVPVRLGAVWVRVAAVGSLRGDWVVWAGNTASMMSIPADVSGLVLSHPVPLQPTQFQDPDAVFEWEPAARADAYRVEVWSAGVKRSEHQRSDASFTYTLAQNRADGGPRRTFELRVWGLNGGGESETAAVLAVTNPQMPASAVAGQQVGDSVLLSVPLPTAADYAGTRYVVSQNAAADPAVLSAAADVPNWAATVKLTAAGTWYFWAASYDQMGADNLNWSPRGQITIAEAANGVPRVTNASLITAAAGSSPPGGEAFWAVFDNATGKIWRWRQATGTYTKALDGGDLTAASIAADRIAVGMLSAISVDLGDITAGTLNFSGENSWQFLRTHLKWWGDGVNGWIMASQPVEQSHFSEFRASSGQAVVLEQRAAWAGGTGYTYYTYVKDGNGVERLIFDPATGNFLFRGQIQADSGSFGGSLAAATGSFSGTLTASAVNAVSRINIGDEQITIARAVSGTSITFAPSSMVTGESIKTIVQAGFTIKGKDPWQTKWSRNVAGSTVDEVAYAFGGCKGTARILINGSPVKTHSFMVHGCGMVIETISIPVTLAKGDVVSIDVLGEPFRSQGDVTSNVASTIDVPGSATYLQEGWIVIQGCAK